MNKECSLTKKNCIPCKGDVPALGTEEVHKLLSELNGNWAITNSGHLYKKYKFKNFITAMDFANKITSIAEHEGHHPNLTIFFGGCGVEIWTHKINGLSENDFILAAKIDAIN